MQETLTLNDINIGEDATVCNINSTAQFSRRLFDIGVITGAKIRCVGKSMFGDPKAFCVCGAVIAIRNDDSKNIIVKRVAGA